MSADPAQYCRHLETYLCRKNDGHLVRIVGPTFELVCGWAARGIPLKVACRGIDRYFERHHAKGPRRRPVRIEFCEADVLDVFDEWRRAVGIRGAPAVAMDGEPEPPRRGRVGLRAQIDRTLERLSVWLATAGAAAAPAPGVADDQRAAADSESAASRDTTPVLAAEGGTLHSALDRIAGELDALRDHAHGARGEARAALIARLRALDDELLRTVRSECPPDLLDALRREAHEDLLAFENRMEPAAFERAMMIAADRLLRERLKLPVIAVE